MSQISAYGIGAGRTIAGESDDDNERLRQGRLTAAQRIEQERRSATLRERIVQAERAAVAFSSQLQAEVLDADAAVRDTQNAHPSVFEEQSRKHSVDTRESDRQGLVSERKKLDKTENAMSAPLEVPAQSRTQKKNLIPSEPLPEARSTPLDNPLDGNLSESESLSLPAVDQQAGSEPKLEQRIPGLVDELPILRGPQFTDKLVARLNDILSSIRSHPQPESHEAVAEDVHALLDFLEGYAEAASANDIGQQKLMQLFGELRQQLFPGIGAPSQAASALASTIGVASKITVDKGAAAGVTELRVNARQRSLAADRRADSDHAEEIEAELSVAVALLPSGGSTRPSKSSLSKDAEKRQEETLISVTVRSV